VNASWTHVIHVEEKGLKRLQLIAEDFATTLDFADPGVVFIEGISFGSKGSSYVLLVQIQTMFRMELYRRGLEWYEVPPSTLKKWVTGKGNAKSQKWLRRLNRNGALFIRVMT
jgi:Holliday junction resolvasome RuvABC endonuclease subunit